MEEFNGIMMQYFEWYLDCKQNFWNDIKERAPQLAKVGINAIWLPPAYKGIGGADEVGYGTYDVYDLGEFDQKGTVKTKYGSKDEYLECIQALKKNGIEVYADVVLNHKMGADMIQTVPAVKVNWQNHNEVISDEEVVKVATKYTFPGRKHKYSDFEWNWTHFDGIDYNNANNENALFKFKNKDWEGEVDEENGNYDYLMGADLDFENPEVVEECKRWGKWYIDLTKIDGFRLDAVKHIPAYFYDDWIRYLRETTKRTLFTVGEYWSADVDKLHRYITGTKGQIALFDVPLHYNMYQASIDENYDLRNMFNKTLVQENGSEAVTFVDNHDTQPGQALQSFIEEWFKQAAYAIILLRNSGYPCIFYGDYYGIPHDNKPPVKDLDTIIQIRKQKAYGKQNEYFDDSHYVGWTREGDDSHPQSGLAVVISNSSDGEKKMFVGQKFAGQKFKDALNICPDEIIIDNEGYGIFKVKGKSASIWVL